MKYGKYEYERSFLVKSNEPKQHAKEIKHITDTYLIDTNLRLRKVEKGLETQYKLTQKNHEIPARSGVKKINTLYLSSTAYEKLCELPGFKIKKTRYILEIDKKRIGIDLIQMGKEQIYIAEVEFEIESEMKDYSIPFTYIREITNDPEYNGFEIARKYAKST
jgi:CYTH domain-containing protein